MPRIDGMWHQHNGKTMVIPVWPWIVQSDSASDTKLEEQLKLTCARIQLAGDELGKVVQGTPDANPAVRAVAGYLFRQNDQHGVADRLRSLHQACSTIERGERKNERTMDLVGDEDNPAWIEQWKKIRRKSDDIVGSPSSHWRWLSDLRLTCPGVQIMYTTGTRFAKDRAYDLTWLYPLPQSLYKDIFENPNTIEYAYTIDTRDAERVQNRQPEEESPTIMQLSPGYVILDQLCLPIMFQILPILTQC